MTDFSPQSKSSAARSALQISVSLSELGRVRDFVAAAIRQSLPANDASERIQSEVQLAVTELVSNIVRHGFVGKAGGFIRLIFTGNQGHELQFSIRHNGHAFACDHSSVAPVLAPSEGGMGLFLVQQCVDSVRYETLPDGTNQIHIQKMLQHKTCSDGPAQSISQACHANSLSSQSHSRRDAQFSSHSER